MSATATPDDVIAGRVRWCIIRGDAVVNMLLLAHTYGRFCRAVLCDAPYHLTSSRGGALGFMGKSWDGGDVAHRPETWKAALLCCIPGAFLIAASSTRTYHRLACAVEDAGFDITDQISWLYATGMAKTGDVSKRIDKAAGAEREVVSRVETGWNGTLGGNSALSGLGDANVARVTSLPATDEAREWEGHSESLAPSVEPMVLARAPFDGSSAANVVANGCGVLNIDAARIGTTKNVPASVSRAESSEFLGALRNETGHESGHNPNVGRWPKNVAIVHSAGCARVGTRRISGASGWSTTGSKASENASLSGPNAERAPRSDHFTDADGLETVESWQCVEGCAALALDLQAGHRSGLVAGSSLRRGATTNQGMGYGSTSTTQSVTAGHDRGDEGNASRFFAQFGWCNETANNRRFCDRCGLLSMPDDGMVDGCETASASSAPIPSPTGSTGLASAQSGAQESPQPVPVGSPRSRKSRAKRAASDGSITQATIADSAPSNVPTPLPSSQNQSACDAESRARSPEIASAQSHAHPSPSSDLPGSHGRDSIESLNSPTLTLSPAQSAALPESTGTTKTTQSPKSWCGCASLTTTASTAASTDTGSTAPLESAPFSRFRYESKASASERWCLVTCACGRRAMRRTRVKRLTKRERNVVTCLACNTVATVVQHATVKPLDLDRWLARLIVPRNAVVLVPFAGSGSEMIAVLEARLDARVIGIELDADHHEIATARLTAWDAGDRDEADEPPPVVANEPRQRSLFDLARDPP